MHFKEWLLGPREDAGSKSTSQSRILSAGQVCFQCPNLFKHFERNSEIWRIDQKKKRKKGKEKKKEEKAGELWTEPYLVLQRLVKDSCSQFPKELGFSSCHRKLSSLSFFISLWYWIFQWSYFGVAKSSEDFCILIKIDTPFCLFDLGSLAFKWTF